MPRRVHKIELLVPKNYIFDKIRSVLLDLRDRNLIELAPALVFDTSIAIIFTFDSAFITFSRIMVDIQNSISFDDLQKYVKIISDISFEVPENLKQSDTPVKFDAFGLIDRIPYYNFDHLEQQF